jgi:hydrophobe/amphiphile efflux-3 (HAE3) family protein
MWKYLTRLLLRNRIAVLAVFIILTAFMAYHATKVKMSYKFIEMLPKTDSTSIINASFNKLFGNNESMLVIGMDDEKIKELENFNKLYDLTQEIQSIKGVNFAYSITNLIKLSKDTAKKEFVTEKIIQQKPTTQAELDSIFKEIYKQKIYDGLIFKSDESFNIMAVTLDNLQVNSSERFKLIDRIQEVLTDFESQTNIDLKVSGMPYIRTIYSKKLKEELILFAFLTLLIASIGLLVFFRSFKAVFFPMIIVIASVIFSMGILSLLNFEITALTGILPPLTIIIAVENCIFLLNKYYLEIKSHKNKAKSLSRMIQRVGTAMLLTNLTTAVGFSAFVVTQNKLLVEFGIVSSLTILSIFILSISLIPILFSFTKPPKKRHTKFLESRVTNFVVEKIKYIIAGKRTKTYVITVVITIIGIFGVAQLKTSGYLVDDIPKNHPMYKDLMFFEDELNGIIPFEIMIDTKKPKGILRLSTLKKIDQLQDTLAKYPNFTKALSVVELVKASKQAYYNNNPEKFDLISGRERAFIMNYLPDYSNSKNNMINAFMDTNMQITRVSLQMENLSTPEIDALVDDIRPKIDSIFDKKDYQVDITGNSVVFAKGTNYLINNLLLSLLIAIIIITFIMSLMFKSPVMIAISIIPNLIPQILTAAFMGYFQIPIKPTTILIFSIALGISVDNTIHYLSRYRMELIRLDWDVKTAVYNALKETANSMLYSSIILLLGFSVFMLSSFGGTESLGKLIAITLLTAMIANLIVLPALLLTMDKQVTKKNLQNSWFIGYPDLDNDND